MVLPGSSVPDGWQSAPRVMIGDAELGEPAPAVEVLHRHWVCRQPVVVELAVDPEALRAPERCDRAVYELGPGFEFAREHLQFLVWANNYDARTQETIWWQGRRAARLHAGAGVRAAVRPTSCWPTARPLFVDGGPPRSTASRLGRRGGARLGRRSRAAPPGRARRALLRARSRPTCGRRPPPGRRG